MIKSFINKIDLAFTILLTLLCILSISVPYLQETPVRIILAFSLLIFLPGYSLIAMLFPRRDGLDWIERGTLSLGLSIACVPLVGLGLNYTPFGIRLSPVLFVLSTFTISFSLVAWIRRMKLPVEERFRVPFERLLKINLGQNILDKSLSLVLIASIIGSSVTLIYVVVTPKTAERFTEFYLLDTNGKASDFPTDLKIGEEGKLVIGIVNHEYENITYRLEVYFIGSLMHEEQISLTENEKWESPFIFKATDKGENQKLEFSLYKNQEREAYRTLRLWVNARVRTITLFHQDYAKIGAIPDNVFQANPIGPSVVSTNLTYSNGYLEFNSTRDNGELQTGQLYISGLVPMVETTYRLRISYLRSPTHNSEIYIYTPGAWLFIKRLSDDRIRLRSYYHLDGGRAYEQIDSDEIIGDGPFLIEIKFDGHNKENTVYFDDEIVKTPFRSNANDLPYDVASLSYIMATHYLSEADDWSSVRIFEVNQTAPRELITPIGTADLQPFGQDGLHNFEYVDGGIEYLNEANGSGTLWLDIGSEWFTDEEVRAYYKDLVANKGWEVGIHYSARLIDIPWEEAIALMQSEFDEVTAVFGVAPSSFCSLQNADNIDHAIWAHEKLGMVWRNGIFGTRSLSNVGNLDDAVWPWWDSVSSACMTYPTFTHRTDQDPAIAWSISWPYFTALVDQYETAGIRVAPFYEWYMINTNSRSANFTNVVFDPGNRLTFNVNTNGYPTIVNVALKVAANTRVYSDTGNELEYMWHDDGTLSFWVEDGHSYTILMIT